jgi:plastocyanin
MTMTRTLALGALAGLVAVVIATATSPARAADIEVKIDNFTFNPQTITVKAGDTVVWTNHDDIPHTVTSKTMVFRSKAVDTDDKFSFTFAKLGTFPYFCSLHPHMTGTIVVEAATGMITPPGQHGSQMSGTDITLHKVNIR